jgi:hypothetical protein
MNTKNETNRSKFLALVFIERIINGKTKYRVHSTPKDHAVESQGAGHKVPGRLGRRRIALMKPLKSQYLEEDIEIIKTTR